MKIKTAKDHRAHIRQKFNIGTPCTGWVLEPYDNEDVAWRPESQTYTMPSKEDFEEALKAVTDNIEETRKPGREPLTEEERANKVPANEILISMFRSGEFPDNHKKYDVPLNAVIDKDFKYNGVQIPRYRRVCLKCGKQFIGVGKFNRRCLACKGLKVDTI